LRLCRCAVSQIGNPRPLLKIAHGDHELERAVASASAS
jgi:hypothetical protein